MKNPEYEALLTQRLAKYFDITTPTTIEGREYRLRADHTSRLEQTVLGKGNVVDYYETCEICLCSAHPGLTEEELFQELTALPALVPVLSRPSRTHKSTLITRIMYVEGSPPSAKSRFVKLISRFTYTRVHRFYFHGWTEIRLIVVFPEADGLFLSPAAKRDRAVFLPGITPTEKPPAFNKEAM